LRTINNIDAVASKYSRDSSFRSDLRFCFAKTSHSAVSSLIAIWLAFLQMSAKGEVEALKKEIAELKDKVQQHMVDPEARPRTPLQSLCLICIFIVFVRFAVAETAAKRGAAKVSAGLKQRRILKGINFFQHCRSVYRQLWRFQVTSARFTPCTGRLTPVTSSLPLRTAS